MPGAGRCGARLCSPAPQLSPPLPSSPSAPLPALRSPPAPPAAPRVLERRARGSGGSPGRPGARARRQWGGARPASPRERKGCGETPAACACLAGWAGGVPGRATRVAKAGDTRAGGDDHGLRGRMAARTRERPRAKAAANFAPSCPGPRR